MNPCSGQHFALFLRVHEPCKANPARDPQPARGLLQSCPCPAPTGHDQIEIDSAPSKRRHGAQHEVHALVALQAAEEDGRGIGEALAGRPEFRHRDAVGDDRDAGGFEPPANQVLSGALRHHDAGQATKRPRNRPLEEPSGGGEEGVDLSERGQAEQMVHEQHAVGRPRPLRSEHGNLVEVFDDDVERAGQAAARISRGGQVERVPAARAVDLHSVQVRLGFAAGPVRTQQGDAVPGGREPAEDLMKVLFGAARPRVRPVQPVDHENAERTGKPGPRPLGFAGSRQPRLGLPNQTHPSRSERYTASSTPLTKRGDSGPP